MAVKKSTANQRESRVSTPAPKTNTGGYSGIPTANQRENRVVTSTKSSGGSSGFQLSDKDKKGLAKDYQDYLNKIADIDKRTGSEIDGTGVTGGSGKTVVRSVTNADGTVTVFYSDGTSETFGAPTKTPAKKEIVPNVAYDTIQKILESYRITGLASVLETIRDEYPEISSAELITLLQFDSRYNAKFNERFAANVTRQKAGKPVYSPGEYLALEQGFQKVFDSYNLPTFKTQAYYDKFIEGDVDVADVNERVQLAYDRLLSDGLVSKAFNQFYSSLGFSDIIAGMLDPVNQLPALRQKVKAAEIGGAALRQGLTTSELATTPEKTAGFTNVTTATLGADVLAKEGVTKQQAEKGYQTIAGILPDIEKLSSVYGKTEAQYGRKEAEQEVFQGLASAARKRERITELEKAQYLKRSGLGKGALGSLTNI